MTNKLCHLSVGYYRLPDPSHSQVVTTEPIRAVVGRIIL